MDQLASDKKAFKDPTWGTMQCSGVKVQQGFSWKWVYVHISVWKQGKILSPPEIHLLIWLLSVSGMHLFAFLGEKIKVTDFSWHSQSVVQFTLSHKIYFA